MTASRLRRLAALAVLAAYGGLATPAVAGGTSFVNWPAYLYDTGHSSTNDASSAITAGNAAELVPAWTWLPDPPSRGGPRSLVSASPTVYDGVVYIGDNTGMFYALDERSGHVIWKRLLDYVTRKTCYARGITATATVALDPVSAKPTVYVAGARYLYALDAVAGKQVWRRRVGPAGSSTANDYYNWASPTVVAGHIYMGMSSQCDNPLVRGGLVEFSQPTGAVLHTYTTVPAGSLGGSIWSSAAADTGGTQIWVTTGNPGSGSAGDAESIVRLSGGLARKEGWQNSVSPAADLDFGGSATLFTATLGGTSTQLVGACSKDGNYYALAADDLAAGPVWSFQVGAPANIGGTDLCIAAAIWDGARARLFMAGNETAIGGVDYRGSIRELDPASGTPIWQLGLPCDVLGSPSLDGAGVIAVATRGDCATGSTPATYLVDAASGTLLATLTNGAKDAEFAQPVFADSYLLVATQNAGLTAYTPSRG